MYPLSKLFYMRELLTPKEKLLIHGLHFISETYIKANSVLIAKNIKPVGIADAHVQCISSLTIVSSLTKITSMNFTRIKSISMNKINYKFSEI